MTPCEKLGYQEGDVFEFIADGGTFQKGSKVRLSEDDGTEHPMFHGVGCKAQDGDDWAYAGLDSVKRIEKPDDLTTILESAADHDAKANHHAAERERLMQQARDMLPDGWRLVKAEDVPDGPSLTIVDGQDMSDPANWREGDYIVSPGGRLDVQACAPYKIESFDGGGDPRIKDDSGLICAHGMDDFRFHHRPNT